jgi:hypothetical protein
VRFWPAPKKKARAKAPARAKATEPKKKAAPSANRFGWREAGLYVGSFAALLVLGAGVWAWWTFQPVDRLRTVVASSQSSRADLAEIVFADPVVGVEGVRETLLASAYAAARQNPFDRDALRAIHEMLVQSRWMEDSTIRVTRDLASTEVNGAVQRIDRITIHGQFRQPFALVRRDDTDYVVDGSGTRLPVYYAAGEVPALPAIVNAIGPVPQIGAMWRGGDITDGLLLIRYLRTQNREWFKQVRAIDVQNWDGGDRKLAHLAIITDRGYRIAWGRAIGQEAGIEHPASHKVQALDAYYLTRGHVIGSPQGTLYINQPLLTQDRQVRLTDAGDEVLPGG